jgi:hypothetical protein
MTEVATQNNEVSTEVEAWGAGEDIRPDDIVLSKLWIMQGLSKMVTKKEAALGDIVDSQTKEKLGDEDTPVKVLVFSKQKLIEVTRVVEGKNQEEFVAIEPHDPDNPRPEFEDSQGNRRRVIYNFFCLVVNDDGTIGDFPVVVTMRKTSLTCARKMMMKFGEWAGKKRPSAHRIIELKSDMQERNDNSFYVWSFSVGNKPTDEQEAIAKKWYFSMREAAERFKVDDAEGEGEAVPTSSEVSDDDFM